MIHPLSHSFCMCMNFHDGVVTSFEVSLLPDRHSQSSHFRSHNFDLTHWCLIYLLSAFVSVVWILVIAQLKRTVIRTLARALLAAFLEKKTQERIKIIKAITVDPPPSSPSRRLGNVQSNPTKGDRKGDLSRTSIIKVKW